MKTALIMVWTLGILAAVSVPGRAQTAPATLLAAHRGGSLLWPENSLLAFRNALALGADFIAPSKRIWRADDPPKLIGDIDSAVRQSRRAA